MCVLFTICAYGGILLTAVAALVACRYCVRSIPLLIVHGLMWADNVGLFFFLARLSVAPAVRFLFLVGGEARCLAVGLLLGVTLLFSQQKSGEETKSTHSYVQIPDRSTSGQKTMGHFLTQPSIDHRSSTGWRASTVAQISVGRSYLQTHTAQRKWPQNASRISILHSTCQHQNAIFVEPNPHA